MKKLLIIVVLIAIIAGLYWWIKKNDTAAAWQTYRNEERGFEFEYPVGHAISLTSKGLSLSNVLERTPVREGCGGFPEAPEEFSVGIEIQSDLQGADQSDRFVTKTLNEKTLYVGEITSGICGDAQVVYWRDLTTSRVVAFGFMPAFGEALPPEYEEIMRSFRFIN